MKAPLLCLILIFAAGWTGAGNAGERPNLLLIYIDDLGWKDTGFMGSDYYETPNLDRLAAEGMVFTDAYSNAANCAPPRASLMTGQYTPRHRIFTVGTQPRGAAAHRRLAHVPTEDVLDPELVTWAQLMQAGGWSTAIMGKWHLSPDPLPYGFDLNIGGTHGGGPAGGYFPPHPRLPGLENATDDLYLTTRLSDLAADFIRANHDRPWALYLPHFAVHTPLEPKQELLEKYRAKEPGEIHNHVVMATMIEAVDLGIGRIVEALEETGVRERTIIVFTSDNGGYGPATSMVPLRGYKGNFYEGGIRVPMFVVWPGVVEPGSTSRVPVMGADLFPTFCDMLGLDMPEQQPVDGVSLVPLLKAGGEDADLAERPLFWHFPHYLQSYPNAQGMKHNQRDPLFRTRPVSVVRRGPWKLLQYFEDGEIELFHLEEDIGEQNNLAGARADKTREMLALLKEWQSDLDAPIPTEPNPEFDEELERRAIQRQLDR